jgi:Na+-driven multidrug efflux pump
LRFADLPFRAEMFGDILRVGAIAAFSPLQSVLTVLILTRAVAGFGTEALAGYGGARLEFMLVPIAFAVDVASVPMVGVAVGAGRIGRARQVAWTGAAVCAAALGLIGALVGTLPQLWSDLFTANPAVVVAANLYLRWVVQPSPSSVSVFAFTLRRRAPAGCWVRCRLPASGLASSRSGRRCWSGPARRFGACSCWLGCRLPPTA